MSLVPSHDCFPFKEAPGNSRLPIDSRRPLRPQSTHVISEADSPRALVGLLTRRVLIFNISLIHLLARCDRSDDPSARTTGRYL
jgi:hypothetical protein